MTINTLEDVPENTIRQMIDFAAAAGSLTNGKHDFRIPYIVANDWALHGHCVLSTNRLAEQFSSTRRTMCAAIDRLVDAGAIKEIGRTADNRAMFVPCLEIGDAMRLAREARADGRR